MQTLSDEIRKTSSLYKLTLQRGPRYNAYAEFRESKFRRIQQQQPNDKLEFKQPKQLSSPPLPQLPSKERECVVSPMVNRRNGGRSIVGSSVPNFSAILRKENRKPTPPVVSETKTPPLKGRGISKLGSGGGSKSANANTEKRRVMMGRKSCANIQELHETSVGVSSPINGDVRGGRIFSGISRGVLSSKMYGV